MNTFSFRYLFSFLGAVFLFLFAQMPLHAAVKIESWETTNGVKVFFVETHAIPVLDISVDFDAGSRRDPEEKSGLAGLANLMLSRGIAASRAPLKEPALTEAQIADAFADVGAEYASRVGSDRAGMSLRTLSSQKESDKAIRLFARMLSQPSYPADLLKQDKMRSILAVRETLTQPDAIAARTFMKLLYDTHPYAFSPTEKSLRAITRADLKNFYETYYVTDRAVITIVGDADLSRAKAIAEEISMRMVPLSPKRKKAQVPKVPAAIAKEAMIDHPATQSHIQIGMPAIKRGDPDFFPLLVGNYILGGGGFVSRLMQEIREKRGFAYSVFSQFDPRLQKGPFVINLQTKKEQTKEAVQVVKTVFNDFMQNGPTEKEAAAAKDNLVKGFPLRMDNNKEILASVAMIGYYGLPLDYLDTWTQKVSDVSVDDIRAAFARKLSSAQLSTVIVGQSK